MNWDGARLDHLVIKFLLLQLRQFVLELVVVHCPRRNGALCQRLGDFLADGVLIAEVFPAIGSCECLYDMDTILLSCRRMECWHTL